MIRSGLSGRATGLDFLLATKRFLKVLDRTMCFNHAFIKKAFGAATPNYEFKKDVGEEARLNVVAAVIASNLSFNVSIVVLFLEQEH
jgi:hypothetical protein